MRRSSTAIRRRASRMCSFAPRAARSRELRRDHGACPAVPAGHIARRARQVATETLEAAEIPGWGARRCGLCVFLVCAARARSLFRAWLEPECAWVFEGSVCVLPGAGSPRAAGHSRGELGDAPTGLLGVQRSGDRVPVPRAGEPAPARSL